MDFSSFFAILGSIIMDNWEMPVLYLHEISWVSIIMNQLHSPSLLLSYKLQMYVWDEFSLCFPAFTTCFSVESSHLSSSWSGNINMFSGAWSFVLSFIVLFSLCIHESVLARSYDNIIRNTSQKEILYYKDYITFPKVRLGLQCIMQ